MNAGEHRSTAARDVLVIGAGPAGLMAAWQARNQGARVRVLAAGIGTTHIMSGWIAVLDTGGDLATALESLVKRNPAHPYGLVGLNALRQALAALREVGAQSELHYVGDFKANFRLPTALGAVAYAALAPESFVAGDLSLPGPMLITGPAGWRDFYPRLCAGNLARQGTAASAETFDLPESRAGKFDATPVSLARLFERPEVRARVASQVKTRLNGAARAGFPAVLGLEHSAEVWHDLQDRIGVPVFEIPTLPPSVPGIRLFNALKRALTRMGVQVLLDITATTGIVEGGHVAGVVAPNVVREALYRADQVILATGGLYGGGLTTNHRGELRETVFDLPVVVPGAMGEWFDERFISNLGHPIHQAGVRANASLQPLDKADEVVLRNVRVAGRLLAGYNPIKEGSTEGAWLATAFHAGLCAASDI